MACNSTRDLLRFYWTARRHDSGNSIAIFQKAGHFAILDDVDAALVGGAGITPDDGIVPRGTGTALHQAPENGKACRIADIESGDQFLDLLRIHKLAVDAIQSHLVATPRIDVQLGQGVSEIDHAALREHHIIVEIVGQGLPHFHRGFVEVLVLGQQIVRADRRCIAADIAGAEPAFFHHRYIADAMFLGEVVGSGKAVAAADDHHIIGWFWFGFAPGGLPVLVAVEGVLKKVES